MSGEPHYADQVPRPSRGPSSWKTGCPEGHVSTRICVDKGGYYCHTCNRYYDGEPVDRTGGEA